MIRLGICSYSLKDTLGKGRDDLFNFIKISKELGCTQLDPWNAHLSGLMGVEEFKKNGVAGAEKNLPLSSDEKKYLKEAKDAADAAGLPFGCLALDGAHIYEDTVDKMRVNRLLAYRYLEAAQLLKAEQVRIDCGGTADLGPEGLEILVKGYADLIPKANAKGMEVVVENHWGYTNIPDNVEKILKAARGLGLLLDTWNWVKDTDRVQTAKRFAKYAKAVHIKCFNFDTAGNDTNMDVPAAIRYIAETGYRGCWTAESVPKDGGTEKDNIRKTFDLIRKTLKAMNIS